MENGTGLPSRRERLRRSESELALRSCGPSPKKRRKFGGVSRNASCPAATLESAEAEAEARALREEAEQSAEKAAEYERFAREESTRLWRWLHPEAMERELHHHNCRIANARCEQRRHTVTVYAVETGARHVCVEGLLCPIAQTSEEDLSVTHSPQRIVFQHKETYFCTVTGVPHFCTSRCTESRSYGKKSDSTYVCPITGITIQEQGQQLVQSMFYRSGDRTLDDLQKAYNEKSVEDKTRSYAKSIRYIIYAQHYIEGTRHIRRILEKYPTLEQWTDNIVRMRTFLDINEAIRNACEPSKHKMLVELFGVRDVFTRIVRATLALLFCPERDVLERRTQADTQRNALSHVTSYVTREYGTVDSCLNFTDMMHIYRDNAKGKTFMRPPALEREEAKDLILTFSGLILALWYLVRAKTVTGRTMPEQFQIRSFTMGAMHVLVRGVACKTTGFVMVTPKSSAEAFLPQHAASTVPGYDASEATTVAGNITFALLRAIRSEQINYAEVDTTRVPTVDDMDPRVFSNTPVHNSKLEKINETTLQARINTRALEAC